MEEEEKQIVVDWQYKEMCDTVEGLFLEAMDSTTLDVASVLNAVDKILDILDVEYRR